jgi:ABC-type transporter Mla subunit MlaD
MVTNSAKDLTANGGPVTAPVTTSATASISSSGSLSTKFLRLNCPKKPEPSAALLSNNIFSSFVIKSLPRTLRNFVKVITLCHH